MHCNRCYARCLNAERGTCCYHHSLVASRRCTTPCRHSSMPASGLLQPYSHVAIDRASQKVAAVQDVAQPDLEPDFTLDDVLSALTPSKQQLHTDDAEGQTEEQPRSTPGTSRARRGRQERGTLHGPDHLAEQLQGQQAAAAATTAAPPPPSAPVADSMPATPGMSQRRRSRRKGASGDNARISPASGGRPSPQGSPSRGPALSPPSQQYLGSADGIQGPAGVMAPVLHTLPQVAIPTTRRRRAQRLQQAGEQDPGGTQPVATPHAAEQQQGPLQEAASHSQQSVVVQGTAAGERPSRRRTRLRAPALPPSPPPQVVIDYIEQVLYPPLPPLTPTQPQTAPMPEGLQSAMGGVSQSQQHGALDPGQLPDQVTSTNWHLHAAALFPSIYSPIYHTCLYEFLFDLWPAVGRAIQRDLPEMCERAFSLLERCWSGPDSHIRHTAVVAFAECLADSDELQACAAVLVKPRAMLWEAVIPLVAWLHPGELQPGGLVHEFWVEAHRLGAPATAAAAATSPASRSGKAQQAGQARSSSTTTLVQPTAEWSTVMTRLEQEHTIFPAVPISALITIGRVHS